MAYSIGGKIYTDHAMMDEVVYATKIILESIVLKNSRLADNAETTESISEADILLAIHNGTANLSFIPLNVEMLVNFGYTIAQAKYILEVDNPANGYFDRSRIPEEDREALFEFACQWFLDHYDERNDYYRMLNGLPEYGTGEEYFIYIKAEDYPDIEDLAELVDLSTPVHLMINTDINALEALGILNDIVQKYSDNKHYRYLKYLGAKKIDIVFARTAKQWDILYIPTVQSLVLDRFKELFQLNRDIYLRFTYQASYNYMSDYFEEMIMFLITCQTFSDMITDLPEWYVRRDVFDLRTCQYFLESQGVKFFKEIPLKYQIRIVKNLNKLIRYKSTTKNVEDILEIFGMEGTTVYKYYIYKKLSSSPIIETDHEPKDDGWHMPVGPGKYEYGDEGGSTPKDPTAVDDITCLDHAVADDYEYNDDGTITMHKYEFKDESGDEAPDIDRADYDEEQQEASKTYVDQFGNHYELEFVKAPITDGYDKYITNNLNLDDYDLITTQDQYWDGEDVHSYIKNLHLAKDFSVEGTKYMFLENKISMTDYTFQMSYFMNMILSSAYDLSDLDIIVPSIRPNTKFSLRNLCILLYVLSQVFTEKSLDIKDPYKPKTEDKGEFEAFWDINGYYPEWDPQEAIDDYDGGQTKLVFRDDIIYPPNKHIHFYDKDEYEYQENFRIDVDGGYGVLFTDQELYQSYFVQDDWIKNYHYDLFMDMSHPMIYAFNVNADLDEIAKAIHGRHSCFAFEHGYTLRDFGVDKFSTVSKFDTIDELLENYRINTEAYNNLVNKMVYEADNRDKMVVMNYIFNNLFVVPYDYEFYRLSNGEMAENFEQILRDRDFALYKYYQDLVSEPDKETRIENIRLALNEITDTLEYYIKSEDTKWVFTFVPTTSPDAINNYISLMIGFFKSWKVYFLDPHVTYVLDDRRENKVNMVDNMTEYKDKWWYYDKHLIQDAAMFNEKYFFDEDKYAAGRKEIIDIYGFNQWWASDDFDFDGGYARRVSGATEADPFSNTAIPTSAIRNVDGGEPDPMMNLPFWVVDGGRVSARLGIYDLDGGGPLDMKEYVEIDGENVATGIHNVYPRINDLTVPTYDVDGGWVDGISGKTKTMVSTIKGHTIVNNVRNSRYAPNDIEINSDGLYLEDNFADQEELDEIREYMMETRAAYEEELEKDIAIVKMMKDPAYMKTIIDGIYADYFAVTKQVLDDFKYDATYNYCRNYTTREVAALRNWFIELDLFGWEYF